MAHSPYKKENKKNILLLIGIVLVFLFMFEIILIIFNYPIYGFSEGIFKYDENLGHKLSPNFSGTQSIFGRTVKINTNSQGMRDIREYTYERNNKTRILVLGSSYAFGNGAEFEETYVELLRKKFNEEVETMNPSTPAYTTKHNYVYFMNEGIKYNPDIIILPFTPIEWGSFEIIEKNNSVAVNKIDYLVNKQGFLVSKEGDVIRKIHGFLLTKLRTYSFFYSKIRLIISSIINKINKIQNVPPYFLEKNSINYQEDYEGYFNLLWKLKQNTNAKIIIFVAPHKIDLASEEEIKIEYGLNYSVNSSQTKESVKKIAEELQVGFIEIKSNDPDIFLKVDMHWTSRGNQIVADELYLKLQEYLVEY